MFTRIKAEMNKARSEFATIVRNSGHELATDVRKLGHGISTMADRATVAIISRLNESRVATMDSRTAAKILLGAEATAGSLLLIRESLTWLADKAVDPMTAGAVFSIGMIVVSEVAVVGGVVAYNAYRRRG